jgi:hypothetical protein
MMEPAPQALQPAQELSKSSRTPSHDHGVEVGTNVHVAVLVGVAVAVHVGEAVSVGVGVSVNVGVAGSPNEESPIVAR